MNATEDTVLEEKDIRAMVRILGDVAAAGPSHEEKKTLLMNGLCKLLGADLWVWALATKFVAHEQPVYTSMASGGFEEGQFPKLLVAFEHPDLAILTAPLADEVGALNRQITRLREDYDPEDFFTSCEANPLWKAADVGAPLLTYRPISETCVSGIGIYRKFDRPPFSRRDAKIAHIVLTEVPWLHEEGWPMDSAEKVPSLPNRCRLALNLLLEGLQRKTIADRMNLSVHTVNDYTKQIYRYFEVHSQAELITKFKVGDGGDCP